MGSLIFVCRWEYNLDTSRTRAITPNPTRIIIIPKINDGCIYVLPDQTKAQKKLATDEPKHHVVWLRLPSP